MKKRFMVIFLLTLLLMSCDPFMLSLFPGYLPDLIVSKDVSGYFLGALVEHYEFCALNNGVDEYVFLLAYYYNGDKTVYIFDNGLSLINTETFGDFGSRHLVDANNNFVIGNRFFSSPMPLNPSIPMGNPDPAGSEAFGAVFDDGGSQNVLIDNDAFGLNYYTRGTTWDGTAPGDYILFDSLGGGYDLLYVRSFGNLDLTGTGLGNPAWATVFVLRNRDEATNNWGVAVVATGIPAEPLINNPIPPPYSIPLGPMGWDAWAMSAGVLYRAKDGSLKLRLWDGTPAAETRNIAQEKKLHMDYGFVDYYYLFDQDSKKLYKAWNWWQK